MKRLLHSLVAVAVATLAVGCAEHTSEGPDEDPSMVLPDSVQLEAPMGGASDTAVTVGNNGHASLDVEFVHDVDWLEIEPDTLEEIETGSDADVSFRGTCPDDPDRTGVHSTDVYVESNDSSRPEMELPVMLECRDLDAATLAVTVAGLPDELEADVQLDGPYDYQASLTQSVSLQLLPGDYEMTAAGVGDDVLFEPEPASAGFSLDEGESDDLDIVYEMISGELSLEFSGLPDDVAPSAVVEGPGGFVTDIDADETLTDLEPGNYTVVPDDVTDGPATFRADSATVDVASDQTATVDIDYEAVSGDLLVDVAGLPDELDHDVELTDADGSTVETIPQDGQLTDLAPGHYTLIASPVVDSPTTWVASEVDVAIHSDAVAEATIEYLADAGSLVVDVDGLPDDVFHAIDLVDDAGSVISVPQSGQMDAVEPGTYSLEVGDVTDGPATFSADSIDEIVVESTKETTVDVDYSVIPGQWHVDITGLDDGIDADVDVVGGDLDTTLTASQSFDDLMPDTYDVSPGDVTDGLRTWTADDDSALVHSGPNSGLTVDYQTIPGQLHVDITGLDDVDGQVDVIDDDGLTVATVTASTTLTSLEPGNYDVVPRDVTDGPATFSADATDVDVASADDPQVTVDYSVVPGELAVDAHGLDGLDLEATVDGPDGSQNVDEATTLTDLPPGDYTVTFEDVDDDDATYRADPEVVDNIVVESDRTATATGDYHLVSGDIELTVDFPADTGVEVHLRDDDETIVWSRNVAGADTSTFTDLDPGAYTFELAEPMADQWNNEYVDIEGFDVAVDVASETTADHTVSGTEPTLVTSEEDDGLHSLREVVDRVNPDSVVTFEDDVRDISLDGGDINIEDPITISGHDDRSPDIEVGSDQRAFSIDELGAQTVLLESLTFVGADDDADPVDYGGAIRTDADLQVRETTFTGHTADWGGGAIQAYAALDLEDVELTGNVSEGSGGAVRADELYGWNVRFADNQADSYGGAAQITQQADIQRSRFVDNHADAGGGALDVFGPESFVLHDSLVADNTSSFGGGLWLSGDDAEIKNSTFDNNSATDNGGGIHLGSTIDLAITHVTITRNDAPFAPGVDVIGSGTTIGSSLIADNDYTGDDDDAPHASELYVRDDATIASHGYNVIGRLDDQFFDADDEDEYGDLDNGLEAHTDVLHYNGADMKTVRVSPDSPAYQNIPEDDCVDANDQPVVADQRGFVRPVDELCTAGAWQAEINFESFSNLDLSQSYATGDFIGDEGFSWDYVEARDERSYPIQDNGIMLGDASSSLSADAIEGGVDTFRIQYRKAHSGPSQFDIRIDDEVVYTSPEFEETEDGDNPVHTVELTDLDVDGTFDLEIDNLGEQVVYDNIYWE